jgi:hypothetical protein
MRLDRDGVQAAAASLRWADLDRIEIKSDADDAHRTTVFILRNDAQLQPGGAGYNTSSGPKIKNSNLELYDWSEESTLAKWFTGPITHTSQTFKFVLGGGACLATAPAPRPCPERPLISFSRSPSCEEPRARTLAEPSYQSPGESDHAV